MESHDTYCNAHESAGISCDKIRQGWAFLVARRYGQPLFFSRPYGSSAENVWGNNIVGARGNDEFFHPEVVAANKFRKAMLAEDENITLNEDKTVVAVNRGKRGAMVINITENEIPVSIKTNLPDGKYVDDVHNNTFRVKKGILTGTLAPTSSYALYKK